MFKEIKFIFKRLIHTNLVLDTKVKANKMPPRLKWDPKLEFEIEEKFLYGGSGAGGQAINRTASKVQLKHIPTGIVVVNQFSRSQKDNRKKAREILMEKIESIRNSDGNGNGMGMSDRALAVYTLKKQRKENRERGAAKKYKKHDSERSEINKKKLEEERMMILKMTGKN
ncbi:hypothetical protein QEN19_000426 [Hanseniaspora menglaensis]